MLSAFFFLTFGLATSALAGSVTGSIFAPYVPGVSEQSDARAKSIVMVIKRGHVWESEGQNLLVWERSDSYRNRQKVCGNEPEAKTLRVEGSIGSGVLIGEDVVLSAGHLTADCRRMAFVFGVHSTEGVESPTQGGLGKMAKERVFYCQETIARVFDGQRDYAILRLNRKVPPTLARPARLRPRGESTKFGEKVEVYSHPLGMPLRVSAEGVLKKEDLVIEASEREPGRLRKQIVNVSVEKASSGGAVFNRDDGMLEAILTDAFVDDSRGCYSFVGQNASKKKLANGGAVQLVEPIRDEIERALATTPVVDQSIRSNQDRRF